jgi:hypothetical protein
MEFTFFKTLITAGLLDGPYPLKEQANYKVFDGRKPIGEYYHTPKESELSFEGKRIKLKTRGRWPLMPKVTITDHPYGETVGKIKLSYIHGPGGFGGYPHEMILENNKYWFKELKPDVRYSLFKRETRGYYKFKCYNEWEEIIYTFKIDFPPGFSLGNNTPKLPFAGAIDYRCNNLLLLFAGFYLIEAAFDQEGA